MTVESRQGGNSLTRPWVTAAALAALFVALEGLMAGVYLLVFFAREGDQIQDRWEIFGNEWWRYALYALLGLAAAYVLRQAARSGLSPAWPTLIVRTAILYVPVSLAMSFLTALLFAVTHDHDLPLYFFGLEVLG